MNINIYQTDKHPGYELLQHDIEINFQKMVSVSDDSALTVLVVGAWRGDEIRSFLRWPSLVHVYAFEPNPETYNYLTKSFSNETRVTCLPFAAGEKDGTAKLYSHNTTSGTDSLLQAQSDSGLETVCEREVEVRRLDGVDTLKNEKIDLFWIDVQGFELSVFKGATNILSNVRGIFVELNYSEDVYKGAVQYEELDSFLSENGFKVAHIELAPDPQKNGGVAFYVRESASLDYFSSISIKKRLDLLENSYEKRLKYTNNFMYYLGGKYLPITLKAKIKRWLP